MNLWEETLKSLEKTNKHWDDVLFISNIGLVCSDDSDEKIEFEIPKNVFEEIAHHINYNNGFGRNEINLHLKIVGDNWWLERYEYDGSERWAYKELPKKPQLSLFQAKAILLDFDENLYINENI